jgi:hypothetical protein
MGRSFSFGCQNSYVQLGTHKKLVGPDSGEKSDQPESGRTEEEFAVTKLLDFLIKRGHTWENLIDGYPVSLVKNLFKAGRENDNLLHLELVTGMSIAVTNAIDLTFNKGKGKVLDGYIKALIKANKKLEDEEQKVIESKGVQMSRSALAFFNALPRKEEEDTTDGNKPG